MKTGNANDEGMEHNPLDLLTENLWMTCGHTDCRQWLEKVNALPMAQVRSARIASVVALLQHITQDFPGQKVVIFSKYLKFLDLIDRAIADNDFLKSRRVEALRFDGTVSALVREACKAQFRGAGHRSILLITGGAGLNLQCASYVV